MKSKAYSLLFVSLVALFWATSSVHADSYFLWDAWGGTWHDAEKSLANTEDDLMCWAAAASNILHWGGWDAGFATEQAIFQDFQDQWTDVGGMMEYGWHWWFDGTLPPNWPGWSQVDVPGGGNHYLSYGFADHFHQSWGAAQSLATIDQYLHAGYGTTLAIYDGGHAITVWGYEYDGDIGAYQGIYVTDSDDYLNQLAYYTVSYDATNLWWDLGPGYLGWHIVGAQGLERRVPEPASMLLMGAGLLAIAAVTRRKLGAKE